MTSWNLTKAIKAAMPAIKLMGRAEIAKAHAMGLPGVYMRDDKIVHEYPGGRGGAS